MNLVVCFSFTLVDMLAIFLDSEANGLDATRHVPIDIAFQVVDVTTGQIKGSYNRVIKQPRDVWDRHDPSSLAVNGFTWEQICQGTDPQIVHQEIIDFFTNLSIQRGKSVFICQNPAFDRAFFSQMVDVYTQERLNWPYHWLDLASMFWAMLAQKNSRQGIPFPETLNLSKNEIAKAYGLPPEEEPHRAMNGVKHLTLCYQAVLGVKFTE